MKKTNWLIVVATMAALLILLCLSLSARKVGFFGWDLEISRLMQSHRSVFLDTFFWQVSWPGYPPQGNYITGAIILFLLIKKWFKEAFFEFTAAFLQVAVGYSFKFFVDRPRPSTNLIHVVSKGLEGGKYSFPAGHVESFVAIFGFLAIILMWKMKPSIWQKGLIAFLVMLIIFIGPSRVYMGEHWTSDVIGAYLVGFLVLGVVFLGYKFSEKIPKLITKYKSEDEK